MKKFMTIILAVVMIIGMCCGCGVDTYYSDDTTIGEILGVTSTPEPTSAEPTVTPNVTEPTSTYKTGDYVYVVYDSEGAGLCVRLGVVIAEADGYVYVTHCITNIVEDLEKMVAELTNSSGVEDDRISLYPIEHCYRTSEEAWAVTGKEPLESLETPSGNIFDNR